MNLAQKQNWAMLAVAVSGAAWGLFWIPLRALEAAGIEGVWAVALFYIVPLLVLSPLYFLRRRQILGARLGLHLSGIVAGIALVLYAGSLVFTDVVRALLFFYLTPLWSTLLSRLVIREAITRDRWVTIILALSGLLIILRVDAGLSIELKSGDIMGLAAGVVWAVAAVCIKSEGEGKPVDVMLSYFMWGTVAAMALAMVPVDGGQSFPDFGAVLGTLYWFLPVVLILVIPPAIAVMWGASIISPGLLGVIFMTEITAGTITAAIWAEEPFGWRELIGVLLITAAGLWEPVRQIRATPKTA